MLTDLLIHLQLHQRLKRDTASSHQALEKRIVTYIKNMATISAYADLLKAYYAFIGPLEQVILNHIADTVPEVHSRIRHHLLEEDIKDLIQIGSFSIQQNDTPSFVHNEASALGALYVLEGSTLGGKFIVQMIRQRLPLENSYRYFSGYAEQNELMWKAFTEILNGEHSATFQQDAITAATHTFNQFEQWLQLSLPPLKAHV